MKIELINGKLTALNNQTVVAIEVDVLKLCYKLLIPAPEMSKALKSMVDNAHDVAYFGDINGTFLYTTGRAA